MSAKVIICVFKEFLCPNTFFNIFDFQIFFKIFFNFFFKFFFFNKNCSTFFVLKIFCGKIILAVGKIILAGVCVYVMELCVCVYVSKSHYLCIQRICFQTLLNSRDLFVSHVYRQLDNKNPKMYIKIPRCS